MRYGKFSSPRLQDHRAVVFVDYDNLFNLLDHQTEDRSNPDEVILEIMQELERYLLEEIRTPTILTYAFADFSQLGKNGTYIQNTLALNGITNRFVPSRLQDNSAEIQLVLEAVDTLHCRPDLTTYVFVTGNRLYLPLAQKLKHYGKSVLVACMDVPTSVELLTFAGEEIFLNAANLLSENTRSQVLSGSGAPNTLGTVTRRDARVDVTYHDITDPAARHTLEIVEEHFGQYEEVYLTPLLRKLSELLDEDIHDPKTIINDLEKAGATWLEKRRGFPYDYTVLIVDTEHPDVRLIRQEFFDRQNEDPEFQGEEYADTFYYDDYVEEDPLEIDPEENGTEEEEKEDAITKLPDLPSDPTYQQ